MLSLWSGLSSRPRCSPSAEGSRAYLDRNPSPATTHSAQYRSRQVRGNLPPRTRNCHSVKPKFWLSPAWPIRKEAGGRKQARRSRQGYEASFRAKPTDSQSQRRASPLDQTPGKQPPSSDFVRAFHSVWGTPRRLRSCLGHTIAALMHILFWRRTAAANVHEVHNTYFGPLELTPAMNPRCVDR